MARRSSRLPRRLEIRLRKQLRIKKRRMI